MLLDAQAIIDSLPDLIALIDLDGTIFQVNRALCRALRIGPTSLTGQSIFDVVASDRRGFAGYLRRCSGSADPLPGRVAFGTDGAPLDCRCDAARLRLPDHRPGPILLRCRQRTETISQFMLLNQQIGELTREIAARHQAEAALREMAETLEQRVVERTRQLALANEQLMAEEAERRRIEQALHQSQKMEAVGQLTGGVAHDFNNLLTVVLGALEVIEIEIGGGRLGRLVQSAKRAAERGARLTGQLLAFSRQQVLRARSTNVNQLIAGMSELLSGVLGANIELRQQLASETWPVLCDPNQLQSAILNLVLNSRDAMPAGGRLTIETGNIPLLARLPAETGPPPGAFVLIAVSDTGSGIPADIIDRVFEPFYSTKGVGKGTGLGLSQVYGFVNQSGGHARIYSETGFGTTVKLYLPRSAGDPGAEEGVLAEIEDAVPEAALGDRQTVLVVEDDPAVRDFAAGVLREAGYRVFEAADGREALRILRQEPEPIDLLFTDIVMPGANGSEVARQALELRPAMRVLFTSGYTANALPLGGPFTGRLLQKPYRALDLAREVRQALL